MTRQYQKVRGWLAPVPWWSLVASGALIGVMFGLSINVSAGVLPAALSLIGVVVGGAIAAMTNIATAQAGRRAQLAATIWPKRVEVHQAGFEIWWRVAMSLFSEGDDLNAVIIEAQTWWTKNCLYLSKDARNDFKAMINSAREYSKLVERYREAGDEGTLIINENWDLIYKVGHVLADDAGSHLSAQALEELKGKARRAATYVAN